MSTKRTPPPKRRSPANFDAASDAELDYTGGSLPNVSDSAVHNVNVNRMKRKRESDLSDVKEEIRDLFASLETEQKSKFYSLQTALTEIKTQNSDIQSSMEILYSKNSEIQKELESLRMERKEHLTYIQELESRLENLERISCSAKVEIRNIPKIDTNEDKISLRNMTLKIGSTLGICLEKSDVRDAYRGYAKTDKIKPIMVEFTSVIVKDCLMKGLKSFNDKKVNKDKLNTTHLGLAGPASPVYISESLTSKAKRLHYLAREFAKAYGYTFCWISYGKIYLRKAVGLPFVRVDDEAVLNNLKKNSTPMN